MLDNIVLLNAYILLIKRRYYKTVQYLNTIPNNHWPLERRFIKQTIIGIKQ